MQLYEDSMKDPRATPDIDCGVVTIVTNNTFVPSTNTSNAIFPPFLFFALWGGSRWSKRARKVAVPGG